MNILYFDTETHDYHEEDCPADPVQLAAVLSSGDTGRTIMTVSTLINRVGWTAHGSNPPRIADRVITKHGITDEVCRAYGEAPQTVMDMFRRMLARAGLVVAHNISFDISVMNGAMSTMRLPPLAWPERYCTMRGSAPVVRIPSAGRYNIGGYKAPKLAEAFHFFTGRDIQNAHDALADVFACRTVHRGILKHQAEQSLPKIALAATTETG